MLSAILNAAFKATQAASTQVAATVMRHYSTVVSDSRTVSVIKKPFIHANAQ